MLGRNARRRSGAARGGCSRDAAHPPAWRARARRLTVPEGHRFEATQALRQVLNRAVAWKLIDENPAKRGVPNPV